MGKADHAFTTGTNGVPGWVRDIDATAPNGEAMRSGAITHGQTSLLTTTVDVQEEVFGMTLATATVKCDGVAIASGQVKLAVKSNEEQ